MKIRRFATSAIAAATVAALVGCSSSAPGGGSADGQTTYEKQTIKINTGVPPTHHLNQNVFLPWKEKVEEATDGAVTVELYDSNTLGSLSTVLADMESGLYDVGIIVPTFFLDSPTFALTVANLVAAAPDQETGNEIAGKFFEKNKDSISVPGVEILGSTVTTMYEFWTKDKVSSIADLKGMQVRVGSAIEAEAVELLGVVPVQVAPADSYQALERATVKGAYWPPESALSFKLPEVAPHLFETKLATTAISIGIRDDLMDGFSDPLRELFENDLVPELPILLGESYGKVGTENESKIADLVSSGDLTVTKISPEEARQVASKSESLWKSWSADAKSRGLDGDQLIADWLALMDAAGVEKPF